jgi:hypothetical protein
LFESLEVRTRPHDERLAASQLNGRWRSSGGTSPSVFGQSSEELRWLALAGRCRLSSSHFDFPVVKT